MSCKHKCETTPPFPRRLFNRPGLDTLDYRIGGYSEMRAHMLALMDAHPVLAAWTHRGADDPGIALVEGAAVVGDILSFYQTLYANEYFLRTAKWRESVADLVKLLGYRLAPGLGGEASFALLASGDRPVAVPKGFGFKAQIEGQDKPAVFETTAAFTAYPFLSDFHLYRPRITPAIRHGSASFQIIGALPQGLSLSAGDRLLLGVASSGASPDHLDYAQIAVVDRSWESFGKTFVAIKGGITSLAAPMRIGGVFTSITTGILKGGSFFLKRKPTTPTTVQELYAFKLGESFRHRGHNAPTQIVSVDANGRAAVDPVSLVRRLDASQGEPADPALASTDLPLDAAADDLSPGTQVVVEGRLSSSSTGSGGTRHWLVRTVESVEKRGVAWGAQDGPSTVLRLDDGLATQQGATHLNYADLRSLNIHVVAGAGFRLNAEPVATSAATGKELDFYGSGEEVQALTERALLLCDAEGGYAEANVAAVATVSGDTVAKAFLRITLDRDVDYADFDHDTPTVSVYGNVVAATEGKTEAEVVLGDGDRRQVFQTFAVPKSPLTWLLHPDETPSHHAELEIYVDGVLWQRLDSLFGAGPDDPVYVVRQDAEDKSYIQFGDGKSGARLPSGKANVVARYRTGSGSTGPLKADTTPQPNGRLAGLDKVVMPAPAVGGAEAETEDTARVAAPGRMQSLGRLVSLADFEAEVLAVPGVLKARAACVQADGTSAVRLTVLTASESDADAQKVADTLAALNRAKGSRRFGLQVVQGRRRYVSLALNVGFDPRRREEDVRRGILEALGVSGAEDDGIAGDHGLFSLARRQFGQSAHSSQIVAAVQQVQGVAWAELTRNQFVAETPLVTLRTAKRLLKFRRPRIVPLRFALTALLPGPKKYALLACDDDHVLALEVAQVDIALIAEGQIP